MFGRLRDDYVRHGSTLKNTALWALAVYRFGRWSSRRAQPLRWLTSKVYGGLQLGVELGTGIHIPRETRIGEKLHLVHAGNIKIHSSASIGDRVSIMHDVTIGNTVERDGVPVIGNDVFIGAGAKILGGVHVGDGALIAANSLVITDVPPGHTAIGVPARAIPFSKGAPKRMEDRAVGEGPHARSA
jgi:serine O-acetyltransferase